MTPMSAIELFALVLALALFSVVVTVCVLAWLNSDGQRKVRFTRYQALDMIEQGKHNPAQADYDALMRDAEAVRRDWESVLGEWNKK